MSARFQPDAEAGVTRERRLVDPEAYDASEQQFAASLEGSATESVEQSRDENAEIPETGEAQTVGLMAEATQISADGESSPEATNGSGTRLETAKISVPQSRDFQSQDPEAWRQELAARLNNYRARRRPREPRYPSLQLKFESSESWAARLPANGAAVPAGIPGDDPPPSAPFTSAEVAFEASVVPAVRNAAQIGASSADATARIIPFPRSGVAPPRPLEELAEPVPDRPRILDVPDIAPPPPALGGILLESAEEPVNERRPGFEVPLQSARLTPRIVAAAADGALVLCAIAMSGWIFFKLGGYGLPPRELAGVAIVAFGMAWFGYQYLLLACSGTTPGLKLARLRLSRFDGSIAPRRIRRFRVLASILSGLSLGLGYAWCALDEDQLCWHDRITRTYVSSELRASASKTVDS